MPDVTQLLGGFNRNPGARQIMQGVVSSNQPAPAAFTDPLYVLVPELADQNYLTIMSWPALWGASLPQKGAECLLLRDSDNQVRCVWWDGTYSGEPSGAAGGALSGTYPNPSLAAGAAAANLGAAGGVLSGTYPNPGFATKPDMDAHLSANSTKTTTGFSTVPLDTASYDPASKFGSHGYVCPSTGRYDVFGAVNLLCPSAGQFIIVAVFAGTTEAVRGYQNNDAAATIYGMPVQGSLSATAGTVLTLAVYCSAANATIEGDSGGAYTHLSVRAQ